MLVFAALYSTYLPHRHPYTIRHNLLRRTTHLKTKIILTFLSITITAIIGFNILDHGIICIASSDEETNKNHLASIVTALKAYKRDTGTYPTAEQGLAILLPSNPLIIYPPGYDKDGYLIQLPTDTNEKPFEYYVTQPNDTGHYLCPNEANKDLTRCRHLEDEPNIK